MACAAVAAFAAGTHAGRHRRRARMRQRTAEHAALVESLAEMHEGLIVVEDGRLVSVNAVARELLGWSEAEMLAWPSYLEIFHPEERERIARNHARRMSGERFESRYESALRMRSGARCEVDMAAARLRIGNSTRVVVIFRDITAQKRAREELRTANQRLAEEISQRRAAEARLREQALHDGLTGLLNRSGLTGRMERALAEVQRRGSAVGVMFLDLDGFKQVNDSLGHKAGDELLQAVAQRLRGVVRATDTVARLAGDEFVILCEGFDGGRRGLEAVAAKVLAAMAPPFQVDGGEAVVTTSIGATLVGPGDHQPDMLLRRADEAMYRAKRGGKNTCRFI